MLPPFHRPSRSGAGLAALLGYGPRQAFANSLPQPRESLGDVLSRSIPKTLQELLADSLGVALTDTHEQEAPEPDTQQPEPDTVTPRTGAVSFRPFKQLPPLPPLPELINSIRKWAAPLALTPAGSTGNTDHE